MIIVDVEELKVDLGIDEDETDFDAKIERHILSAQSFLNDRLDVDITTLIGDKLHMARECIAMAVIDVFNNSGASVEKALEKNRYYEDLVVNVGGYCIRLD